MRIAGDLPVDVTVIAGGGGIGRIHDGERGHNEGGNDQKLCNGVFQGTEAAVPSLALEGLGAKNR